MHWKTYALAATSSAAAFTALVLVVPYPSSAPLGIQFGVVVYCCGLVTAVAAGRAIRIERANRENADSDEGPTDEEVEQFRRQFKESDE